MVIPGYDDLTLIGRGGFAHVYRARQQAFHREVAVKVLLVSLDDERDRRRFERECAAMGRLTGHPHIVTVLESGVTPDGNPFLTTPFYESGTLADRLAASGPFGVGEVLATGVALAGALDLAHANGILHRDVKPANVLLSAYGEPALADFGIAVIAAEAADRTSITHAFTITHAPPEILDGRRATEVTDVYSLASTLWTMLAGAPPFGSDDGQGLAARVQRVQHDPVPALHRTDVPAALDAALAKRPEDRPTSARAFGELLRAVQRERGDAVTPLRSGAVAPVDHGRSGPPAAAPPTATVAWPPDDLIRWADDAPMPDRPAPAFATPPPTPPAAPAAPAPPVVAPTAPVGPPQAVTPRPAVRIDPPPLPPVAPAPSPQAPPWPAPTERRRPGALVATTFGVIVVVVAVLVGVVIVRGRTGDDPIAAPSSTTTVPPTTGPTTGPSTETTPAPSTAPPTSAAPTPAGPASAIVPDGAPAPVRAAATRAQDAANALAAGDWASARRLIPSLATASDAALAEAWGGLDRSTLVVVDWKERGPTIDLRLGQVADEEQAGVSRTSLYCVTWTLRDGAVVAMADQQVLAAPWRSGTGDPADARAVLDDGCSSL